MDEIRRQNFIDLIEKDEYEKEKAEYYYNAGHYDYIDKTEKKNESGYKFAKEIEGERLTKEEIEFLSSQLRAKPIGFRAFIRDDEA
eukprot:gene13023-7838_t